MAAQPGKGPLNDPPTRQDLKAGWIGWRLLTGWHPRPASLASHNLQRPIVTCGPGPQSGSLVAGISPQMAESWLLRNGSFQHWSGSVPVSDAGRMDDKLEQESLRINDQVPFPTIEAFASVVATGPPFSVVLTDWLSMIAPLGWRSRPARSRTSSRKLWLSRSKMPASRHNRK
jgi:hypothetical protein